MEFRFILGKVIIGEILLLILLNSKLFAFYFKL